MDPVALARMANEFFTMLPDSLGVPSSPLPAHAAPTDLPPLCSVPATTPAAPPEISLPSDKHFSGLPANIGPASFSPVTAPAQATPPAAPGVIGTVAPDVAAGAPSFSFLQDARPIFSDRNTLPEGPYPRAKPITAFIPQTTAPASPSISPDYGLLARVEPPSQPPATTVLPHIPGLGEASPVPTFSFLEELRPLFSYPPTIPGPVPATPETDLPTNTALPNLELPYEFNRSPELAELAGYGSLGFFERNRNLDSTEPSGNLQPLGIESDVPRDLNLSSYPFDAEAIKRDFPILRERVNGRPLVWLDNAATTQKPQSVIDRLKYFYEHENSNVHRAAHELAARATDAYESAREKVRRFVNASSTREIVFVRGATEGINLIAQSWGRRNIQKDDEIVITWLEHHANIVPWQMLCSEKGARLRVAPVDDSGQVLLEEYEKLLGPKTRLVAITQVSNALGVITPADKMIEIAHRYGVTVLLDGAQSVSHMRVDVQALDCDFFVFSGHKVFGPTGIGVVYGKPEALENMPPWQGGGNMIQDVTFEKTLYQEPPQRFEAGTGNIADTVALGAAIDYLDRVGMHNISRHEHELLVHATSELVRIPGLHIIGTAKEKAGVLSFVLDGFRTEEVGDYLNRNGIAVRSGHHCAQPILRRFGLESTVRVSLALYNTHEDIDKLVTAIWNLRLGRTSIA
ncbi:MAG: family 2A encapsulin nanocompartment cargo protein cysteine desulfurase [Edaphobacter sp.]